MTRLAVFVASLLFSTSAALACAIPEGAASVTQAALQHINSERANKKRSLDLEIDFINRQLKKDKLKEWLVMLPEIKGTDGHQLSKTKIPKLSIIGRSRVPSALTYSKSNRSGKLKSHWTVEHCQVLPIASLIFKSIFGP